MYDPACLVLAKVFLGENAPARLLDSLAQRLQDEAEDWIETEKSDLEAQLGIKPSTPN